MSADVQAIGSTFELQAVTHADRRPSRSSDTRPVFPSLAQLTPPDTPSGELEQPAYPPQVVCPPTPPGLYKDTTAATPGVSLPATPGRGLFDVEDPFTAARAATTTTEAAGDAEPENAHALPPVDRGRKAILFLVGATLIEGIVWGLPYSIGVLHEYWARTLFPEDRFPGSESTLTLASTLCTGLLFMSGALLGPVFAMLPWYEREIQIVGLVISTCGVIGAAFVTQPWQLVIMFGFLYPCASATYLPCATNIFEWFNERRGLANGIMYAGTGAGGMFYPFIVTSLLRRFTYRTTMISIAITFCAFNIASMAVTKRRIPLPTARRGHGARRRRIRPKVNWTFLKKRTYWLSCIYILVSCLGNFIPLLWIPTYAADMGLKNPDGTGIVAIINGVGIFGNILSGYFGDHCPVALLHVVYASISALACIFLWGWGTTAPMVAAFGVVWGMTGAAMCGFWARLTSIISDDDPTIPQYAIWTFLTLKGIGAFTSGPISTALLGLNSFSPSAPGAYGATNYGPLIIFVGVMMFGGALFIVPVRDNKRSWMSRWGAS